MRGSDNRDRRFDDEYKGYEHAMQKWGMSVGYKRHENDGHIESDYTSIYSSDDDGKGSFYYLQIKRWTQMQQRFCCCCKWKCCLEGSFLCNCCNGFNKFIKFLIYYKWFVIMFIFLILTIFVNIYSFSNNLKHDINKFINDEILKKIDNNIGFKFDLLLFTQIVSIMLLIMVFINLYLSFKFYKMKKMNHTLSINQRKYQKQIDRGRQRREVIMIQKGHLDELYNFGEKVWTKFSILHENFPFWIKHLNVNLTKFTNIIKPHNNKNNNQYYNEEDEKTKESNISINPSFDDKNKMNGYISNLRKIYNTLKIYNKEIEGLILKKLKHDIEDDMNDNNSNDIMLQTQFNKFTNKIPKKYRKMFIELKSENNENVDISYNKFYTLLNKLLENYGNASNINMFIDLNHNNHNQTQQGITMTSDRLSNEPASISNLYGGYLAYGDEDLQFDDILSETSMRKPTTTSNVFED